MGFAQKTESVFERKEIIVEKEENAGDQHFLNNVFKCFSSQVCEHLRFISKGQEELKPTLQDIMLYQLTTLLLSSVRSFYFRCCRKGSRP